MRDNETQETEAMLALTTALMNLLILVVIGGMFWLAQTVFAQFNQFNNDILNFLS